MAMTVQIDLLTGSGPTFTSVSSAKFNREDTQSGTTPIPTPTATGTNFSYVKTFQVEITATGSLSMTNIKVGKVTSESITGTKLWHATSHSSYTQATTPPTATSDNNSTAPTLNGATATALPLIGSASVYAAGAFSSNAKVGNMVEIVVGIDATNTTAGTAVSIPTLRWQWTEG